MATAPRVSHVTPLEYLALERRSERKNEYIDGVIVAMSGGSISHNILVANLIMDLGPALRQRGCQIYPSDLKVHQGSRFFYPDVSAVCGDPAFLDARQDVVLNPSLIIEVLSPSTERYDKGMKFLSYQQIPALEEYLLVHQDRILLERYRRHLNDAWIYTRHEGDDATVEILGCAVNLPQLYTGVTLTPPHEITDEV